MNVVDSSGWLSYIAGDQTATYFATAIEDIENLLVPSICLYEVFKRLTQQRGLSLAQTSIGDMYAGQVVDLNGSLALNAAQLSIEFKLPMADSMILAVAREYQATLWTQDEHFKDIPGVRYIAK